MQAWYKEVKYLSIIEEINILHKFSLDTYLSAERRKELRRVTWQWKLRSTNDVGTSDPYPPPGPERLFCIKHYVSC